MLLKRTKDGYFEGQPKNPTEEQQSKTDQEIVKKVGDRSELSRFLKVPTDAKVK